MDPHEKHIEDLEFVSTLEKSTVSFPSMKSIMLSYMENMKEIWCGQLQSGSFCNLTKLDVRGCLKLRAVFTPSVARYLLHLQYLHIIDCFSLEVVVAKEDEEDGMEDTTLLPKLETVELNKLPALERFCYVVHDLEYPMLSDIQVKDCPQLKTFSPGFVHTPILNNVRLTDPYPQNQVVTLWEDNLNSTIAHLHKEFQFGSRSLQRFEVSDIDTLENLANAEASSLLFTTLEKLSLENLDNLHQLSHNPLVVVVGRFKNLTSLGVSKCHKLKNLFHLSVATEFMYFKTLVITNCKSMEEVIHEEDETNKLAFPKLEGLKIEDLPSLVSFCRGIDEVEFHQLERMSLSKLPKVECLFFGLSNQSFFPHKVSFPSMKSIMFSDMANMKEIWCGQLQSGSFCNLTSLYVEDCPKLRVVFTPFVARYLVHLQDLTIWDCSLLEVVVAKEEEEDGVEDTTLLPKLKEVVLSKLPSLECFCHVAHDLEYPILSDLKVMECPQLKTFSPGFVRTPILNNVSLIDEYTRKQVVTLWEDNLNSTIAHLHKEYQFGSQSLQRFEVSDIDTLENLANAEASSWLFTTLETLSLKNLDDLQQLSYNLFVVVVGRFKNPVSLCVSECNKLKNLFQLSVETEFMHLKKIVINDCKSMEEVIWKEHKEDETNTLVFPKVERLEIDDLPSLVSFSRGIDEIEFPQLESAFLSELPQVESLFSGLSNQSFFPNKVSFPSLESIFLVGMVNMKEIWCGQFQSEFLCNLTSLHVTGCHKLHFVLTPSVAKYLVHLRYFDIIDCSMLEVVIAKEEEEDGLKDATLLPKLEIVELNELPSLESFCHVAHDLEYPMLSHLKVIECPQLKTFSPGFVRTPILNNVRLTDRTVEKQVTLWEDNLNNTIAHLHK